MADPILRRVGVACLGFALSSPGLAVAQAQSGVQDPPGVSALAGEANLFPFADGAPQRARPLSIATPQGGRPQLPPATPASKRLKTRKKAPPQASGLPQRTVRLSVGVEETYTSNVRREPKAVSDLVSTVSPSISVRQRGRILDASLDTTFNYETHLRKSETNRLNVDLQGLAQAKVIPDLATIDFRSFITRQQTNAASSAQTDRAISGAAGEQTVQGYSVGPQLGSDIGDWAKWQLGYRLGRTYASAPLSGGAGSPQQSASLSDSQSDKVTAALETGQRFSFVRSRLSLSNTETKRSSNGANPASNFGATTVDLTTQYLILPHLSAILAVGNDDYQIARATRDVSGPYLQAGFEINAGAQADFRLLAGQRYNDVSLSGEARYRPSKRMSVGLTYADGVSTQQNQFLESLEQATTDESGAIINTRTLQPFNPNAPAGVDLSDSVFREQRLSANASVLGVRNTVTLSGFLANRANLTQSNVLTASGLPVPENQQSIGGGLQLNHRFTPSMSGQLGVNSTLTSASGGPPRPDSMSMQYAAAVTERLSPTAALRLKLGFSDQYYLNSPGQTGGSTTGGGSFRPIQEFIATVGLRKEF